MYLINETKNKRILACATKIGAGRAVSELPLVTARWAAGTSGFTLNMASYSTNVYFIINTATCRHSAKRGECSPSLSTCLPAPVPLHE